MKLPDSVPPAAPPQKVKLKLGKSPVADTPIKPASPKPLPNGAIEAWQGIHGQQYRTVNPSSVDGHLIIVEFEGFTPDHKILLRAFYDNLQEWTTVKVDRDYLIIPLKEGTVKLPSKSQASKKVAANSPAALGTTTKKPVRVTWAMAFDRFGRKEDAPKLINAFMTAEFPGRKTMWLKWTNAVRILYNRGELGGNKAPKETIPPYGGKRTPPPTKAKKGSK